MESTENKKSLASKCHSRVITVFCAWPRLVGDKIYWLKKIKIYQECRYYHDFGGGGMEWVDVEVLI